MSGNIIKVKEPPIPNFNEFTSLTPKFIAKICDGTRQILALCDHKFAIVKKRFETGLVLQPLLSPLMTHARFPDNRPPPCRYARFASLALSTGGDNPPPKPLRPSLGELHVAFRSDVACVEQRNGAAQTVEKPHPSARKRRCGSKIRFSRSMGRVHVVKAN